MLRGHYGKVSRRSPSWREREPPAERMVGKERVRTVVAFLTNDSAARVRGRLVITEAPVQYTSRSVADEAKKRTPVRWRSFDGRCSE